MIFKESNSSYWKRNTHAFRCERAAIWAFEVSVFISFLPYLDARACSRFWKMRSKSKARKFTQGRCFYLHFPCSKRCREYLTYINCYNARVIGMLASLCILYHCKIHNEQPQMGPRRNLQAPWNRSRNKLLITASCAPFLSDRELNLFKWNWCVWLLESLIKKPRGWISKWNHWKHDKLILLSGSSHLTHVPPRDWLHV